MYLDGSPYWDDDYSGYDSGYGYDYDPGYVPDGAAPTQSWYYCQNPAGYYPYVQNCAGGWQPVPMVPPGTLPPN